MDVHKKDDGTIPASPRLKGLPTKRVFMVGSTGTIGQATVRALLARGHEVASLVRPQTDRAQLIPGPEYRVGDVTSPSSLRDDGFQGERFDAVVSCMASRTGVPKDAWAIDHKAHCNLLDGAQTAGVSHFLLLSAICVQKPQLAFQYAKLAFEEALTSSGLDYSIVRPTAFFKSLSGQVDRVRNGKAFLTFGDGQGTACKPISDEDLAQFMADCLVDPMRRNRILPIGGPGPALTPHDQGNEIFALTGRPPKFSPVPLALFDVIAGTLGALGTFIPPLKEKAELARIGRYYASESMLVFDKTTNTYSETKTPSFGSRTLADHYADLINKGGDANLGSHKVF